MEAKMCFWEGLGNMIEKNTNKISCNFQGHKIILKPLFSKEVNEDQIKMKIKRENEKGQEENKNYLSYVFSFLIFFIH